MAFHKILRKAKNYVTWFDLSKNSANFVYISRIYYIPLSKIPRKILSSLIISSLENFEYRGLYATSFFPSFLIPSIIPDTRGTTVIYEAASTFLPRRWRATPLSHQRHFSKMVQHLIELTESMYYPSQDFCYVLYIFHPVRNWKPSLQRFFI